MNKNMKDWKIGIKRKSQWGLDLRIIFSSGNKRADDLEREF